MSLLVYSLLTHQETRRARACQPDMHIEMTEIQLRYQTVVDIVSNEYGGK